MMSTLGLRLSIALCVLVAGSWAHLCLLSPRQRSDLDISGPGSHTCFRHGAQCGGTKAGAPVASFVAGQTVFIQWQQNFNHYEVGHPGFMDIAIATSESASEFHFLAGFGDVNWHQQSHQQNYTVPVVIPNIECSSCVIRARYSAHKPGETTFYQCSDVTVRRAQHTAASDARATQRVPQIGKWRDVAAFIARHNAAANARSQHAAHVDEQHSELADTSGLYGLTCNPLESPHACGFVRLDPETGMVEKIGGEHYGVDAAGPLPSSQDPGEYILDQVVAYGGSNLVYYLVHSGTVDDNAQSIIAVKTGDGKVLSTYSLTIGEPINALLMTDAEVVAFQIYRSTVDPDSFDFRWSRVDLTTGKLTQFFQPAKPEGLYVNYLWSTYDSKRHVVYYLMGNENAPFALTARLYAVDLHGGAEIAPVAVNVTNFTMGSIQYDAAHDRLLAFSPGLFSYGSPQWSLVSIDPHSGAVSELCHIAPAGLFKGDYTGGIFFGDASTSTYYIRLRALTEGPMQAEVIASVTLSAASGCSVRFSQLGNFYHIHNLAFLKTTTRS